MSARPYTFGECLPPTVKPMVHRCEDCGHVYVAASEPALFRAYMDHADWSAEKARRVAVGGDVDA